MIAGQAQLRQPARPSLRLPVFLSGPVPISGPAGQRQRHPGAQRVVHQRAATHAQAVNGSSHCFGHEDDAEGGQGGGGC